MTSRILRVSKRVAIILLIAVFSIVGIIACGGGQDITGSRSTDTVVDDPTTPDQPTTDEPTTPDDPTPDNPETPSNPTDLGDNNGDHNSTTWNLAETKGKVFYGSSYRSVYVPLNSGESGKWIGVSYNDTDRLTRMWKAVIDKGVRDGKRRMYIKTRDGDLFFDKDYNVRWSKKPDTVLKWFQGGAIALLRDGYGDNWYASAEEQRGGVRYTGKFIISGLYTFAMHLHQARNFGSDSINEFFWYRSAIDKNKGDFCFGGRMELLVLHPGYPVDLATGQYRINSHTPGGHGWTGRAYAAQLYTSWGNLGYDDGNHYLYNIKGNSPERYMPGLNRTHQIYHLKFRWAMDKTYDPVAIANGWNW